MYEVVLEDEDGNITAFGADAALDEQHARELARIRHPHLSIVGVLRLEE